jgi:chromatin structure-remodeling complex subunit RSC4
MFLALPSKRAYPDYYQVIKRPVSLNQVKEGLDRNQYPTLEAVKNDLEQCFVNAKRYNQRESQIFKDAKLLHVRSPPAPSRKFCSPCGSASRSSSRRSICA